MALKGEWINTMCEVLNSLPDKTWFDVGGENRLEFQAYTQADVERIRGMLPPVIWNKNYVEFSGWWAYSAEYKDIILYIYAVKEAPRTCKAIVEKKIVIEKFPTAFEERAVEKEVIVGWDCGQDDEAERTE